MSRIILLNFLGIFNRNPITHIKQDLDILSNMWLLLKCYALIQPAVRLGLVSLFPNLCENCIIESKIYSVTCKAELKLTEHYHPSQVQQEFPDINVFIFKREHCNQMAKIVKVLNMKLTWT